MTDIPFGLTDNENSDVLFVFKDEAGNVAVAPTIDAGSITATSSDTTSLNVTVNSDNSGVTATADGALDTAVVVTVEFTVNGTPWSGSETFNVGASAPTQLTLAPQTPNPNTPIASAVQHVGYPVGHTPVGGSPEAPGTVTKATNTSS